jgi:hypothetical protein
MTKTTTAVAALLVAFAAIGPAHAGGLDEPVVLAPIAEPVAPAGSLAGLGTAGTIGLIAGSAVAIGLLAAALDDDDDDDAAATTTTVVEVN